MTLQSYHRVTSPHTNVCHQSANPGVCAHQRKLPPNLSVLPPRPGKDIVCRCVGRKIMYEADASGTVTLKSLGRDGMIGGSGEMLTSFVHSMLVTHRATGAIHLSIGVIIHSNADDA